MKKELLLFYLFFMICSGLKGQTCCSGGVPVSANLGMPQLDKNMFQVSLSADFNYLNTLKSQSEIIADQSRQRITNAALLELGFSITNKFSVDLFAAYVQQRRAINNTIGTDLEVTNGLGDLVTLLKYAFILKEKRTWLVGGGIKWPTGLANLKNNQGIILNADLQPGSGARDIIFQTSFRQQFKKRPSLNWTSTAVVSWKGVNPEYLGTSSYQFGNEWQINTGLADQFLIQKMLFDATFLIRYRKAGRDQFDQDILPSTGGDFLFLNPGLTYWVSPQSNVFLNLNIPIYSQVVGTQLAPTFQLNVGFYYRRYLKKSKLPTE